VWSLSDGKRLATWRLPGGKEYASARGLSVAWLDSDRVLTRLDPHVILWKVPECERLWTLDRAHTLDLSKTRKYLLVCPNETRQFLDTETAKPCGHLDWPPEGPINSFDAATFSPDGREVVAACNLGARHLIRWNMKDGTWAETARGSGGHSKLSWLSA